MPREPFNIVILGASFAGLSAAHYFLDNTVKSLSTIANPPRYRVVLISPSSHFHWNVGAPRALVSPSLIPHSQSFVSIKEGFKQHPFTDFTFKQGTVIAVDPSARNQDPYSVFQIQYHSDGAISCLILATGSSAISPLLSLHGPHENTINALNTFHDKLNLAKSILIVGGGPSGVESAGQLATFFKAGPKKLKFRSTQPKANESSPESKRLSGGSWGSGKQLASSQDADPKMKTMTLLSGRDRLLPRLSPAVSKKAKKKLKRLGVHVVHNIRQLALSENPDGTVNCHMNNAMTITADVHIAATGVEPNTAYLPPELVNGDGYVVTDPKYLRVYGAGGRVYALDDCASYSKNCVLDVYDALPVLMHNLKNDLLAYELRSEAKKGFEVNIAALQDLRYEQNPTESQLIPITRRGGVGVIFDVRVPSPLVHWLKGRDYGVRRARAVVEKGNNPYTPGLVKK
ncbi:hypothetical protein H2201_007308 [Coniosporium apollinis]|uniref:FAD/NAD(P)-binding domain-containing protein n=1 Tax=Coniosporium apollinis TaxID=61459 RepID=A0ABQ9NMT0_9PEZI|nr:hypothetical protein H2201_007308 [Coniosporium apollinis]